MIETIASVIRGEGIASAVRRASERIAESMRRATMLARRGDTNATLLNVSATPVVPRLGGVPIQLRSRLAEEQALRRVALFSPGILEFATHARRVNTIREALSITGARAIHLEGTHDAPIDELLRLVDEGIDVIVTLHDFTLKRRELVAAAKGVIAPSQFVLDEYGMAGHVIEPGTLSSWQLAVGSWQWKKQAHNDLPRISQLPTANCQPLIAFAGAVKPHKGAHLLQEIAVNHVFGGGDEDLLRALRRTGATIHGYYRAGALPSLLVRHRIGLVVLPSIVPESFNLTLSESWLAGIPVVAFDHGAIAERIRKHGGGWLAPLESGAAGLAELIARWRRGETIGVPGNVPMAIDAARAHVALYDRWGLK